QKMSNQYKINGKEGHQIQKIKKKYPLYFKLDVLRFKQDTGASYKETANAFGISEPSIIANWKSKYLKEGAEGLNKPQGRSPKMHKPEKNQKKTEEKNEKDNQVTHEIELLKKENEYLRIELEYLKKLKELGLKDPRANNKSK